MEQVQNHSVWTLSSDSESCPDDSSLKEDKIHHEESSAQNTTKFPDEANDLVLTENGEDFSLNETSEEKSRKKLVKVEDHISTKKKKADTDMKGKGTEKATMINL